MRVNKCILPIISVKYFCTTNHLMSYKNLFILNYWLFANHVYFTIFMTLIFFANFMGDMNAFFI